MSEENVEIPGRATVAFNRGDRATAFADYHPEIEYRDLQHAPDSPERLHGRAALAAYGPSGRTPSTRLVWRSRSTSTPATTSSSCGACAGAARAQRFRST